MLFGIFVVNAALEEKPSFGRLQKRDIKTGLIERSLKVVNAHLSGLGYSFLISVAYA